MENNDKNLEQLEKNDNKTNDQQLKNYLFGRILCPFSRRLIMGLAEKQIPYTFEAEMSNSKDDSLPIFLGKDQVVVSTPYAIIEYLEQKYPNYNLIGNNTEEQNETRRLIYWCDNTLANNVTTPFIFEKIYKRIWHLGLPQHDILKNIRKNISNYLNIINDILINREYFSCNHLTWADLTLAGHISCLDYLNEINWMLYDELYVWYLKIKSRPSFITILHEVTPGIPSSLHYQIIDFDQDSQKTVKFSI